MVAPRGFVAVCVLVAVAAAAPGVAADEPVHVTTERHLARRHRAAVGMLTAGAALSLVGSGLLLALPACDPTLRVGDRRNDCVLDLATSGAVLTAVGLPVMTAGAMELSDARRQGAALGVMTPAELAREIRRSGALALGAGIGYTLALGTAFGGMAMYLLALDGGGSRNLMSAGVALMVIGGAASGPTATLSIGGLARWLRLRRIARGPLADFGQRAVARRHVLGGALGALLSAGIVAAGAATFVDGGPHSVNGVALLADTSEIDAGIALMCVGGIGFVTGFGFFAEGLARWRRAGAARSAAAGTPTWRVAPWASRYGGGLRLAGTF